MGLGFGLDNTFQGSETHEELSLRSVSFYNARTMNYTPPTENDILDVGDDNDVDNDEGYDGDDDSEQQIEVDTPPPQGLCERNQESYQNEQEDTVAGIDQEDPDQAIVDRITEPDDYNQVFEMSDLLKHIKLKKLNLRLRRPTSVDGNCLPDALSDLIEKFDIKSVPRDKHLLRQFICESLVRHPQFPTWMREIFKRPIPFQLFLQKQRKNGQYSDNMGFMVTAAAYSIGMYITRLAVNKVKP